MKTIKAIETHYAGCHFRSRLEARWAVFFNHAGIPWQYEPEGFELSNGDRYLPDFLLPDSGTWIEVKGHPSHITEEELYDRAAALPDISGAGEDCFGLMLLTEVPDVTLPGNDYSWPLYDVMDGWGGAHPYGFGSWHKNRRPWAHDNSGYPEKSDLPQRSMSEYLPTVIRNAYAAARCARFEYGARTR